VEITTAPAEASGGNESGQEAQGAPAGADIERLLGEFKGTLDGFGSRFDSLEQRIPEPTPAAADENAGGGGDELPIPVFEDTDYDDQGNLSMEAQVRAIQEIATEIADQRVNAAVSPIIEERATQARVAYAEHLEETYPDLQDEATQDRMIEETRRFAEALGRPDLASEPRLLEVVYLAQRATSTADRETPAGAEREVNVERGGGAGPAPSANADDSDAIGDRIVGRARKRMYRVGS
jgi:hypothetical protein